MHQKAIRRDLLKIDRRSMWLFGRSRHHFSIYDFGFTIYDYCDAVQS
jgi:hypothetical protein